MQDFVICGFYIPFKKSDGKDELVKLLDRAAAKNPKKLTAATAAKLTGNNDLPEIETPFHHHRHMLNLILTNHYLLECTLKMKWIVSICNLRLWSHSWLCDKCKLTSEREDVKCSPLDIVLKLYKVVE